MCTCVWFYFILFFIFLELTTNKNQHLEIILPRSTENIEANTAPLCDIHIRTKLVLEKERFHGNC
jgi:hypothetical protein